MLIFPLRRLNLTIILGLDLKLSAQSVCAMNHFSPVNYQERVLIFSSSTCVIKYIFLLFVIPKNSGFSVV